MSDYHDLLKSQILSPEFVRAVFTGQRRGHDMRWNKLTIRPVMLKDGRHLQFSFFDERQNITKNFAGDALELQLQEVLELPFKHYHLQTTDEEIQVRISKKGKALINRMQSQVEQASLDLAHDREKNLILTDDPATRAYLHEVGIMTQDGRVKANMQNKFKQINKFLELIEATGGLDDLSKYETVNVIDCGCGSGYLTFAIYHHLTQNRGYDVQLTGIDINRRLLEKHRKKVEALGWDHVNFEVSTIIDYEPATPPQITIALHACDTATDEAIAQGITWDSDVIICAPCCHHDLQMQLSQQPIPAPFEVVMRTGILHERMGDILTDTFRALLLRVMGYRTDIVQFVDAVHTPKNLMIRAVKADTHDLKALEEYEALKRFWSVEPFLERLIQSKIDAVRQKLQN